MKPAYELPSGADRAAQEAASQPCERLQRPATWAEREADAKNHRTDASGATFVKRTLPRLADFHGKSLPVRRVFVG